MWSKEDKFKSQLGNDSFLDENLVYINIDKPEFNRKNINILTICPTINVTVVPGLIGIWPDFVKSIVG